MKYKKTILKYFRPAILSISIALGVSALTAVPIYAAATTPPPPITSNKCPDGSIRLSIAINGKTCLANGKTEATNPLLVYLKVILKALSVGVGIAVVGGIVWGGLKYTTARGNASQTQDAVSTITNSVIGLFLYIFMFAVLNFLIPGGIFS